MEEKTCLHGGYRRRDSHSMRVVVCAALKKMSLTAWGMMSLKALYRRLQKVLKQEQTGGDDLTSMNKGLKNKLSAAKDSSMGLDRDVRKNRTNESTGRRTRGSRSSSGSKESPKLEGSPDKRSSTRVRSK